MTYLNLHTHRLLPANETTIPSFGLHPWYLTADWATQLEEVALSLSQSSRPSFIGECGLDRLCAIPYDRQLAAFAAQIDVSERLGLPLLLHCVRAMDDVLRLKRGTHQPWVWHGFRGKSTQLQQLLSHGFYVSFGLQYNVESLRQCPADRLFLETDDQPAPIAFLYNTAAQLRGTTTDLLCKQTWNNLALLTNS